jgi:hypothetical protein
MDYTTTKDILRMCQIVKESNILNNELNNIVFKLTIDPMTLTSALSRDLRLSIQRMCEIILGNIFGIPELDSLALVVGHDPHILNCHSIFSRSSASDSVQIDFLHKF